jgi:hypothetical protein
MIPGITTSTLILTAITIIGSIFIGFVILLAGDLLANLFADRADEHENTDDVRG